MTLSEARTAEQDHYRKKYEELTGLCWLCKGTGRILDGAATCPACMGSGKPFRPEPIPGKESSEKAKL